MVPQLQHNSLISGGEFSDENYITFLTPTEVLIYNGKDTHIYQYPRYQSSKVGGTQQQAFGASHSNQLLHPRSLNSLLTTRPERTPSQTSMNYPQTRKVYDISTLAQVSQPRDICSRLSRVETMPHGPILPLRRQTNTSQNQMKPIKATCEASNKISDQQERRKNH